ncbi:MAG: hypothetical protein QOF12_2906 [Solirubrobacteraceae bacterium]|nr:hypothetical protein [Solirubrobacteraceae bacterium]
MYRSARALAIAGALVLVAAAPVAAATLPITVEFQDFSPPQLDALPGDVVEWSNISERTHTVTAADGSFDSGELPGGSVFDTVAGPPGVYLYHCTIHPTMTGEIDVRQVTLDRLPPAAVPAGQRVTITGRSADPQARVTIERDAGSGFHAIGEARPVSDGSWRAVVGAETTAMYRVVVGGDVSETRQLLVTDRHVQLRATKRGIHVTVTPGDPYARILLERDTREHFGWFPAARARLDYLSRADFTMSRPATVRVLLVDRDGWTPLATSAPLHLRRSR